MMGKRILVIDDDEDILEILDIIFQEEGYEVVLSKSADAAEHIPQIAPDIVILDIRIAGSAKNGGQICTEIKEKFSDLNLPVILISAETDISQIAENCGADAFVSKPFDISQLLLQVKEYLT